MIQEMARDREVFAVAAGLDAQHARLTAAGRELLEEWRRLLAEMDAVANRVRRVATHVQNQGFMGTDISPDDMNVHLRTVIVAPMTTSGNAHARHPSTSITR